MVHSRSQIVVIQALNDLSLNLKILSSRNNDFLSRIQQIKAYKTILYPPGLEEKSCQ